MQATLPMPMTLPSSRRARSRVVLRNQGIHGRRQPRARARRGVKVSRLHARDVVSGMDYYLALLLSKHTAARLKCIVQVSMVASVSKQ